MDTEIPLHGNESAGDRIYHELRAFVLNAYPNQRVASARRLAAKFDVSHTTVMSVVDRLVGEGLVYKMHGRGIFVKERQVASPKTVVFGYFWPVLSAVYYSRFWNGVVATLENCKLRVEVRQYQRGAKGNYSEINSRLLEDAARPEVGGMILPWVEPFFEQKLRQADPTLHLVVTESFGPTQRLTTVSPDFQVHGAMAAAHAADRGTKLAAVVHQANRTDYKIGALIEFSKRGVATLEIPFVWEQTKPEDIAAKILESNADAVCFADDHIAKHTLAAVLKQQPGYLQKHLVISLANSGEDLLPAGVVRVENDGYEIGRQAALAMEGMFSGRSLDNLDIKIKPRLVLPAEKKHA